MAASSLLLFALLLACQSASAFMSPLTRTSPTLQNNNRHDDDDISSTTTALQMGMGEMEVIECDVAIIGGGPAGCTCALYTARADLSTVILDKNPDSRALAITSQIDNYPGADRAMIGAKLLEQTKVQSKQYGTNYEEA